jgi:hypothetical protein
VTGRDVVKASLRLLGVLASGEAPSASEASDALESLNRMISNWSTESLLIYARVRETFTLTPGTSSYTMGSGGTFNTTRPLSIESASIELQSTSPKQEFPLNVLEITEWAAITAKDLTATIPTDVYVEMTNPQATVNLWPVPTAANKIALYSVKELSSISTLDTALAFPPGYEEAIVYNLAVRLAPEYGRPVSAEVATVATESKANIERLNARPRYLRADSGLLVGNRAGFNFITGENS